MAAHYFILFMSAAPPEGRAQWRHCLVPATNGPSLSYFNASHRVVQSVERPGRPASRGIPARKTPVLAPQRTVNVVPPRGNLKTDGCLPCHTLGTVAIFTDAQAAIWRMTYDDPGPAKSTRSSPESTSPHSAPRSLTSRSRPGGVQATI